MSTKKINWRFLLFFLAAFTLAHVSVALELKRTVKETLLSNITIQEMKGNTYSISHDLRRIAFRMHKGDKMAAVIDTFQSEAYDDVSLPVFSPDGKHFAYTARNGSKQMLFFDNKQTLVSDTAAAILSLLFAPDNKNLVYLLREKSKYYLVYSGIKSKPYDYIDDQSIVFHKDKPTPAFVVSLNGKKYIDCNGKLSAGFDEVGFPVFSPDGKQMAFWAKNGAQYFVVKNKKKSKPLDVIGSLLFSENSKHFVYDALVNKIHWVFLDGKIYGRGYESIHSVALSPDGSRIAFGCTMYTTNEFTSYAVVDGKREGPFEQITPGMVFSSDSKNIAYCAQLPISVIKDGEEVELMDIEWFMMYNGVEQKRYNMLQGHPVFSPDNKHMAYAGERESRRIINADSIEGADFEDIYYITYSPDSKHLIYTAEESDRDFIVVDGNIGKKYIDILGQYEIEFDSPKSFHYIAIKENGIYLIEETLDD